ncbi:MAG: type II toxin-antitoxin system VapC family toxin [Planctomycetes bacterium]|nr:type II toxin-antitoxin system VapC family toxin [Planctomycetota bacterium]
MGVIVDTTVCVEVERENLTVEELAARLGEEPLCLAPVTVAEVEYGLHRAKTRKERKRREAALARIMAKPCLHIDRATAQVFGRIAAQLDASGKPSKHRVQDLWTASLALQHGYKVLTQNRSHFEDIPGLTVLSI